MKALLIALIFMLCPSVVLAQEMELITNDHAYVLEDDAIQFGSVGLLTRSLLSSYNNRESYHPYDQEEFSTSFFGLDNDEEIYRRPEPMRQFREEIKNSIIDDLPNMCLIVPNFDGGLVAGCLYHFNPRPSYVRFE